MAQASDQGQIVARHQDRGADTVEVFEQPHDVGGELDYPHPYENKEEEQYMKTKYHIRMKGIPVTSIDKPLETYKTLFEGKAITFNLLKGKPKFKKDKDFSIISLTKFERKIQF